jgi:hypothetical protein
MLEATRLDRKQVIHESLGQRTAFLLCHTGVEKQVNLRGCAIAISHPLKDTPTDHLGIMLWVKYEEAGTTVHLLRWKGKSDEGGVLDFVNAEENWEAQRGYFQEENWIFKTKNSFSYLSQVSGPQCGGVALHATHVGSEYPLNNRSKLVKVAQAAPHNGPDHLLSFTLPQHLGNHHARHFCATQGQERTPKGSSVLILPSDYPVKKYSEMKGYWVPYAPGPDQNEHEELKGTGPEGSKDKWFALIETKHIPDFQSWDPPSFSG